MSITSHILASYILLVNIFISSSESTLVEFIAPKFIQKNIPYSLIIRNSNSRDKFPVDNFVIAFELLKTLDPRVELSVADVTSDTYKGDEYRGFSIKDFFVRKDFIEMLIEFRIKAHGTWFRIRYTSAKSEEDKEAFYNKNTDSHIIMERKIEMFLPYTITMQAGPELREISAEDKDAIGTNLLAEKSGQLRCHATEGLPNPTPVFVNEKELSGATINNVNNDITQLVWMVQLEDHGKQIRCRAGQEIGNITLNVYHYLTKVLTSPVIGDAVPRGSQIKCINKDGFPIPKTNWIFVSGPPAASNYYELRDNESILFINRTAPINSNWTFECTGSSQMPTVVAKYLSANPPIYPIKNTYNFTIIGIDPQQSLVQTSSTGIVVVLIFLMLIIVFLTAIGYVYREKIRKWIQDKGFGAGSRTKDSTKPVDQGYNYSSVSKGNPQHNGADKDDGVCYTEIIATVQQKSVNPTAPMDNV